MTDSTMGFKSSKKNVTQTPREAIKGFGGSLASRVFVITLIFLVIPLLFYCFMMYRYDYALKKAQQAQTLDLMADLQVFMLDQLMRFEFQTLELATFYLQEVDSLNQDKVAAINQVLANIVSLGGTDGVFVLQKSDQNEAICILSSGKYKVSSAYNPLFFIKSLESNDYAVFLGEKEKEIYFTKVLKRDEKGVVLETLNLSISIHFFMKYLTEAQGYQGVYALSLFRKKDHIIFEGQEPSLIGKKIVVDSSSLEDKAEIVLKSIPKEIDTYEYYDEGEHLYATILPIAQMDFDILISSKQFSYSYYLREFFYQTILLLVCIIVFGSLGALFLTYLMASPLKKLCLVMTKVGDQDLSARYEKSAYGFEINKVGEVFNTMIQNLLYNLHQLQKQKIKQEMLQQELHIGHQIQKSLIPTEIPEVPGIEIQTVLIPAKEVGGDFYDFFINPSSPDELLLLIADTAGHGVFGCFYSLTMRSILRSVGSTISNLKEMIMKANQLFCKDSGESHVFVTAWIGSYNHKTHVLRYSSCGHPLGYVFRDNRLFKELITPGIALGVIEEMEPVIDSVALQSGDTLIFITDGVIETRNPEGELLGKKRFLQAVENHCHLPVLDLFECIVQELESFEVDPENQEDDVTMVILRIK